MATQVPDRTIPTEPKARTRLHTPGAPRRRQAPEVRARHEPWRTTRAGAIDLVAAAIRHTGPWGVGVFDAGYLAEDVGRVWARRRQAWLRLRQQNRRLETARGHLRAAHGWPRQLASPHSAVAELGPLIPATAERPVTVHEPPEGCFTRAVRLGVSGEQASWTGRAVVRVTTRVDWSAAKIRAR